MKSSRLAVLAGIVGLSLLLAWRGCANVQDMSAHEQPPAKTPSAAASQAPVAAAPPAAAFMTDAAINAQVAPASAALATHSAAAPFYMGADISAVQAAEARGIKFSDNGITKDVLEIMKDHGFNYIRLRVFVDPTVATPSDRPYSAQGFCDLPHTVAMAKRVKAAGMGLLIDFHYSDSWADPGKQHIPAAWKNLTFDQLVVKIHDYTNDAIKQMKDAGGEPDMVQVGNEITPGMMTDGPNRGGSTQNWVQLGRLLKAGIAGVKEVDPKIQVMLHIDKGGDNRTTTTWVNNALAQDVQFDVLGESCYTHFQGPPSTWKTNFESLVKQYPNLKFAVAEVAYEVNESADIMKNLPDGKGLGIFIWEPTQNGNQQGLFDNRGAVIPAMMAVVDGVTGKGPVVKSPVIPNAGRGGARGAGGARAGGARGAAPGGGAGRGPAPATRGGQ